MAFKKGRTAWNKGRTAWNKGLKYGEETKKKISEAMHKQYRDGTRDRFETTKKANEHVRKYGNNKPILYGKDSSNWKGGRNITNTGYVRIRKFGGYVLEHRYVWEQANGKIPPNREIHHINGDKQDNRLENLQCLTAKYHGKKTYNKMAINTKGRITGVKNGK